MPRASPGITAWRPTASTHRSRRALPLAVRGPGPASSTRRAARARRFRVARAISASTAAATPTPVPRRCGRSSASSSPTTSRPIARRCRTTRRPRPAAQRARPARRPGGHLRRRPGGHAVPVPQGRPGEAPALPRRQRRPAQPGGDRARSAIRATTSSSSPARWWWPSSTCTTGSSTACATTASRRRDLFEEARRATTWHYQHVILREFLPGLVGARADRRAAGGGPRLYRLDERPLHPVRVRRRRLPLRPRAGPRSVPGQRAARTVPGVPRPHGLRPVPPEHAVDWTLQIDVEGHAPAQRSKRIDSRLPAR